MDPPAFILSSSLAQNEVIIMSRRGGYSASSPSPSPSSSPSSSSCSSSRRALPSFLSSSSSSPSSAASSYPPSFFPASSSSKSKRNAPSSLPSSLGKKQRTTIEILSEDDAESTGEEEKQSKESEKRKGNDGEQRERIDVEEDIPFITAAYRAAPPSSVSLSSSSSSLSPSSLLSPSSSSSSPFTLFRLSSLPSDLLVSVFSFLSFPQLLSLRSVCSDFSLSLPLSDSSNIFSFITSFSFSPSFLFPFSSSVSSFSSSSSSPPYFSDRYVNQVLSFLSSHSFPRVRRLDLSFLTLSPDSVPLIKNSFPLISSLRLSLSSKSSHSAFSLLRQHFGPSLSSLFLDFSHPLSPSPSAQMWKDIRSLVLSCLPSLESLAIYSIEQSPIPGEMFNLLCGGTEEEKGKERKEGESRERGDSRGGMRLRKCCFSWMDLNDAQLTSYIRSPPPSPSSSSPSSSVSVSPFSPSSASSSSSSPCFSLPRHVLRHLVLHHTPLSSSASFLFSIYFPSLQFLSVSSTPFLSASSLFPSDEKEVQETKAHNRLLIANKQRPSLLPSPSPLRLFPHLLSLSLSRCPLPPSSLSSVGLCLPSLSSLDLSHCPSLSSASLSVLLSPSFFPSLIRLSLAGCKMKGGSIEKLTGKGEEKKKEKNAKGKASKVEDLDLSVPYTTFLSTASSPSSSIAASSSSSSSVGLNEKDLLSLSLLCPSLRRLSLSGHSSLSLPSLCRLLSRCPSLSSLSLSSLCFSPSLFLHFCRWGGEEQGLKEVVMDAGCLMDKEEAMRMRREAQREKKERQRGRIEKMMKQWWEEMAVEVMRVSKGKVNLILKERKADEKLSG